MAFLLALSEKNSQKLSFNLYVHAHIIIYKKLPHMDKRQWNKGVRGVVQ